MIDRKTLDGRPSPPSAPATQSATPGIAVGSAAAGSVPEKPKTAADLLPAVNLPKGGGAIRGMGEKFSVNPVTGTGSLTIPIALSPGRSGFGPKLALSYDSAAGNGPFGLGWSLSIPAITRKTDKGLPQYVDQEESDVFILSGAEDLVPMLDPHGKRLSPAIRIVNGAIYQVFPYRPRIEGLFARIERWSRIDTGIGHWRSISKDNMTTLYGFDADSRITDPDDARKIFSYLICRTWDDKGNATVYTYISDDGVAVNKSQAHEANRTDAVRGTQRYLKSVRYGNAQPYFPDWSAQQPETPIPADWHFQVVIDYGDHSTAVPTPAPDQSWPVRSDPFSSCRAGFEIRTYRRAQRILMFHDFPAEAGVGADCLVASNQLKYSDQQAPTDSQNPIYTFLSAVTHTGHRRDGHGGNVSRSLPPVEMEYSQAVIQPQVLTLDAESLTNIPRGVDGSAYRWVDLDGEGLAGVLSAVDGRWTYKSNLSPVNRVRQPDGSLAVRARFGSQESLSAIPSHSALSGGQQLLDLDGSGRLDLVELARPNAGFFRRTSASSWEPFKSIAALPALDWSDPNVRFVDLTGDGLADVLFTEDGRFTFYASFGVQGFGPARSVPTPLDENKGPKVVLSDGTQTIFLADMTGDGLSDLVRVRDGDVAYFPNHGYGRFGAKVTMDNAPRFTNQERFDPRRVRLADVDGSGTSDLAYIGEAGVQVCFNQSGNSWSEPNLIGVFPATDNISGVQVTDLLGTGTACLVWSSPLPAESSRPLRYVDLMGGTKPHLLVRQRNNLGAETRISYAPSTRFYLADKLAGHPWVTRLPYVVQVADRIEVLDWIGRSRLVTRYAYHHGYFDGYEREFRGFGMVEQWDTEEFRQDATFPEGPGLNWDQASWNPPVLTRTWFHTGAFEPAKVVSRQYAHEYWVGDQGQTLLGDTSMSPGLDPFDVREAYRSLKGQMLRSEVYSEDGSAAAADPYTVIEQNFSIRQVQQIGSNRHGVFYVHPRESLTFYYERNPADPRVTHELTLEVDTYGNVTRAMSIGYPRRKGEVLPEPKLAQTWQDMLAYDQGRLHVRATRNQYTNALDDRANMPDVYRTPLPSATTEAEITGVVPAAASPNTTNPFTFIELDVMWPTLWDRNHDLPYEAIPRSDVDGIGVLPVAPTRRIIKESRTQYRGDDLAGLLAPGQLQPLALPGETYSQTFSDGQLAAVFGGLVSAAILAEGGYVQLNGESGWWAPTGQIHYSSIDTDTSQQELSAARAHFFLRRRVIDPFAGITRIDYDGYDLLPAAATDPAGNVTSATSDYRVLQPVQVTDPNGNRGQVAFDGLGRAVATAAMGKVAENLGDSLYGLLVELTDATTLAHMTNPLGNPAEILAGATTRIVYDHDAFHRTRNDVQPSPPVVYTLARETHVSDLAVGQESRYQHALSYADGFGREIQRKAQAEPGPLGEGGPEISPRWIGSGWTIFSNKLPDKPIRRYEPFFSATHEFEFARQVGVSSVIFYDPPGRVVATLHPNNTWEKMVFDPWLQASWDVNDTVSIADPRTDPDIGASFTRFLGAAPDAFTSWHDLRSAGGYGTTVEQRAAEQEAAQKTEPHAGTFHVIHLDSLGRTCLAVDDNAVDGRYPTRTALDTEGKPLAIIDSLARRAFENCLRQPTLGGTPKYVAGHDMAGNVVYANGMDGGARRTFPNIVGNPIRSWDARGHAFRTSYDLLHRPTHRLVSRNGATELLIELLVYGEGLPDRNLCGRLFRQYDTSGLAGNERYDFKGNVMESVRQFAFDYRQTVDWGLQLSGLTDADQIAAAAEPLLIPSDRFVGLTRYDALNRPIQVVTPYSATMQPNVIQPVYNEANLLERLDLWVRYGGAITGLLDPTSAHLAAITNIDYNARGQRTLWAAGNGTLTTFEYDPLSFRLVGLTTSRQGAFGTQERVVQDLQYTYDPIGNITWILDKADIQSVIFFRNQRIDPSSSYLYDALYRLKIATGREHLGQNGGGLNAPQQVANEDSFRMMSDSPTDGKAMGRYTESYAYDPVGNFLSVAHQVVSGAWTRQYSYTELSEVDATQTNCRLSATSLPGDPLGGPYSARYDHDAHGNMVRMPHLPGITWDQRDRLTSSARQVVAVGVPETTYNGYDSAGQRRRKVTDGQAQAVTQARRQRERLYLGSLEIYREFGVDGSSVTLERETLHMQAGNDRIAIADTRTSGIDIGPAQLVRYQYSNHLGSSVLELDEKARLISYEEYFPYGSTSYQAVQSWTGAPKRYRYVGTERDLETDLSYNRARFYASWIGRWSQPDPAGMTDGTNTYAYVGGNPIGFVDRGGTKREPTSVIDVAAYGMRAGSATVRGSPGWAKVLRPEATRIQPKSEPLPPARDLPVKDLIRILAGDTPRGLPEIAEPPPKEQGFQLGSKTREFGFVLRGHGYIAHEIGEAEHGKTNISTNAARFAAGLGLDQTVSKEGSEVNAFRHVLWQATIAERFGASIARQVGAAHEVNPLALKGVEDPSSLTFKTIAQADQAVDLLNNVIGRQIGSANPGAGMKTLAEQVLSEFHTHGLWTATERPNHTFSIGRTRLGEEQFKRAASILTTLDELGFPPAVQRQPNPK